MAIGGLIRGYRRWNPVHPTYGAFWGIGMGWGCGVGWGPGFGPEVVGFVGSGCGVGFSMGLTLLGVGIGLPAVGVACLPCKRRRSALAQVLSTSLATTATHLRILNTDCDQWWVSVITGAGQRVSQITTIIAPVVSSFATQAWQSMGTHISLLDEQLRLKNRRTGNGSFNKQSPSVETTTQQETGDELHDFTRRSQVKFSTSGTVIPSSQQDINAPNDK